MTTTEAAQKLGTTRTRVVQLIKEGRLSATKRGRDWWITEASVQAEIVRRSAS